ncbi:DNA polymerase III subunit chi [Providencia rettgeri]|uniref:DNA polymerase III subunit chi n=1 Tax=Providencia rettgeri TaxID=587 RepID=A0A379FWZ2_PRORE|nr:DNA polymerase III subunit chi [Providencia rettgeri]
MKKGTFYQLEQTSPHSELEAHEWLACELAAQMWRSGKRVLVACETQLQAEKIDEALWQRDPHQFVRIIWQGKARVMVHRLKFAGRPKEAQHLAIY